MKEIKLTRGKIALVDDADYSWLMQCNSWNYATSGYAVCHTYDKGYYMHRLIMNPPAGMVIDHINRDKLDNRRLNLRVCTQSQNHANQSLWTKNKHSKYKGVTWHEKAGKWVAQTQIKGKQLYLGLYETEKDAARAYNEATIKHFGEFASPNIVD